MELSTVKLKLTFRDSRSHFVLLRQGFFISALQQGTWGSWLKIYYNQTISQYDKAIKSLSKCR